MTDRGYNAISYIFRFLTREHLFNPVSIRLKWNREVVAQLDRPLGYHVDKDALVVNLRSRSNAAPSFGTGFLGYDGGVVVPTLFLHQLPKEPSSDFVWIRELEILVAVVWCILFSKNARMNKRYEILRYYFRRIEKKIVRQQTLQICERQVW